MNGVKLTWLAEVQDGPPYDFGRLDYDNAVFAVEYRRAPDELVLCFRLPCCTGTAWDRRGGEGVAYCSLCGAQYALPDDRAVVSCWAKSPYDQDADRLSYQVGLIETYLQHWGHSILNAAMLAHELVEYLQALKLTLTRPDVPSVGLSHFGKHVENAL